MARERTKFQGVYQRQHSVRRHAGRCDVCYDITYKSPDGKKVWEKVGWTSEGYTAQVASQVRAERVRDLRHGSMSQHLNFAQISRSKKMTFGEGFDLYKKEWLYQVKSAKGCEHVYLSYIAPHLKDKPLSSINALDIERIKSAMHAKSYSAQTIRHALGLVRAVYRKLIAWDVYIGTCPTDKVVMPRVDAGRTRFLNKEEAQTLLNTLKQHTPTWHDITLMSLHTGMRLGEVLALRWEDVNLEVQHVHVRDAKSGSRTVLLTNETKSMLQEREPRTYGLIFPARNTTGSTVKISSYASATFPRIVKQLGFNDGITDRRQKVVFHTLRHTFASWLAIEGVPLYVIGELLGHKTLEMTKRYSYLCPDAKKEAVAHLDRMVHRST